MVSHPDRTLSLLPFTTTSERPRGPSSVVSSSRPSRRHHHRANRSHAGGSTFAPQNEFPIFTNTGDVEIIIEIGGREHRWLLHRLILSQCSGFFEASLSEAWGRPTPAEPENQLARIGEDAGSAGASGSGSVGRGSLDSGSTPRQRWRYELDRGADEQDIPMLIQKPASSRPTLFSSATSPPAVRNKPPASSTSFFRSVANLSLTHHSNQPPAQAPQQLSQQEADLLRDYQNLFLVFYNHTPQLDCINIADAYIQCKSLLLLADLYDALAVVGPRIDHHLLQFQGRLYKQIAKYPASYLRLGYLARSKLIFAEALIHVVGQWPNGERSLRASVKPEVLDLIEDKVDELCEMVQRIETRLSRISLLTRNGERVRPDTGYIDWLAVNLFRSWLADTTSPPPATPPKPPSRQRPGSGRQEPPPAPPPPYSPSPTVLLHRALRTIGSNPQGYLTHDDVKRFLKLTPELYSRDNLRRLERKVEEMKSLARREVEPLMWCGLHGGSEGVAYLVCTRVGEGDWCWE